MEPMQNARPHTQAEQVMLGNTMQLASVQSAEAYGYDAQAMRRERDDVDAPLSARACLTVWMVIAACGWGLIGLVAHAFG